MLHVPASVVQPQVYGKKVLAVKDPGRLKVSLRTKLGGTKPTDEFFTIRRAGCPAVDEYIFSASVPEYSAFVLRMCMPISS